MEMKRTKAGEIVSTWNLTHFVPETLDAVFVLPSCLMLDVFPSGKVKVPGLTAPTVVPGRWKPFKF